MAAFRRRMRWRLFPFFNWVLMASQSRSTNLTDDNCTGRFQAVLMIAKVYGDCEFIRQIEDLNDGVKVEMIASMLPFPCP
jgi:hypothetical protein